MDIIVIMDFLASRNQRPSVRGHNIMVPSLIGFQGICLKKQKVQIS